MPTKKLKPLAPPDLKRCQAEIPNGHSFMTLGGGPGRVRCPNVPTVIAKEKKMGPDGRKGSMSLCEGCAEKFQEIQGIHFATLTFISQPGANFSHYPTPVHPFRESLEAVVGKEPPAYVRGFGTEGLTDSQIMSLQDWCSTNARPEWATGLSMIEAAELIVQGAIENANIGKPDFGRATSTSPPKKRSKNTVKHRAPKPRKVS